MNISKACLIGGACVIGAAVCYKLGKADGKHEAYEDCLEMLYDVLDEMEDRIRKQYEENNKNESV